MNTTANGLRSRAALRAKTGGSTTSLREENLGHPKPREHTRGRAQTQIAVNVDPQCPHHLYLLIYQGAASRTTGSIAIRCL